jgi:hypothetical protein
MTAPAPHLGIEDLIAGLDNAPMDDAAQMHLFSCPHCRSEAARWKTAADGVRTLVGSCDAPPWQSVDIFSAPGGRPHRRWRRSSRPNTPRRRHMLAICTAALALLIGAAYEVGTLTSPNSPAPTGAEPSASPAPGAYGVTGVSGCSGLEVAIGSLSAVGRGSTLEVASGGGAPVLAQTGGSTSIMREVNGSVDDIANGDLVGIRGSTTNGTITPTAIGIAPGDSDVVLIPPAQVAIPEPTSPGQRPAVPGLAVTIGTVQDVSADGFTLVTAAGDRTVTTPAATPVVQLIDSGVVGLQAGDTTAIVGTAGADGTLVAESVVQEDPGINNTSSAAVPSGPLLATFHVPGSARSISGGQCSPSTIAANVLAASTR